MDLFEAIRSIPAGEVRTYGDVSEMVWGHRRGGHVVGGHTVRRDSFEDDVPWWRIVTDSGELISTTSVEPWAAKLESEGVRMSADRTHVADLDSRRGRFSVKPPEVCGCGVQRTATGDCAWGVCD